MKLTLLDKFFCRYTPNYASKRIKARILNEYLMSSAFKSSDSSRRQKSGWNIPGDDSGQAISAELPEMRRYSRDLVRNNPIAAGQLSTKLTHVIGVGFKYHARPDRKLLRMSDDYADEWERIVEREWKLFFGKKHCDITGVSTGSALTRIVYNCVETDGDVVVMFPRKSFPNRPYLTRLQLVEADRLCNPNDEPDSDSMVAGISYNSDGSVNKYHIADKPANFMNYSGRRWENVPPYGPRTGLPNILHIYRKNRPDQPRGIPSLSTVIEPLKMLSRYSDAELMAAVVAAYFTVFIETSNGEASLDYSKLTEETSQTSVDNNMKLGDGLIIGLNPNEKISTANPGRPNDKFDTFVLAILREIGIGLNIPYEILIKHFSSSYSASKAAILEFWKWILCEREFLCTSFLYPVRDIFMWEAVSAGRIKAPGYFSDPIITDAYNNGVFRGPARGHIDDREEVEAAIARCQGGFSTIDIETSEITGGDWATNHEQSIKERKARIAGGLINDGKPNENGDGAQTSQQ